MNCMIAKMKNGEIFDFKDISILSLQYDEYKEK